MNSTYHKIAAFALMGMLLVSPATSFAKNKGNDKKEDKIEKINKKEAHEEEHQCFKAFGHLIARGFMKNKGTVEFPADCFMPFGIKRRFGGVASSTDTTAPLISNVAYLPATSTLAVSWKTNENATSKVYYSTTSPLNFSASSTHTVFDSTLNKDHLVSVTGLTASTTYYVAIESADASGNKATTSAFTLSTH